MLNPLSDLKLASSYAIRANETIAFGYDHLGRRTSLTRGNGVATTYAYDPVSRLAQLSLDFSGTTNDLTLGFDYNPASQIAGNTRSNDLYAWTGHGSGSTSTTSNGLNQIAGWVSTLGHDAKGNITSDGSYSYVYSSENLLTSLANPSGTVQTSSTYAYDPLMRLAVIDSSNTGLDAQLGYDGQEIVFEGLSDSRTRRYVFGPGTDEPLVAYLTNSSGTSRIWYQADERGSNVRLSNDSGVAGGIGKYDEYGVGPGVSRFQYTGQYWLADRNLHYYRARVYDPRLGRFLQPDPIEYDGGMNLYVYVTGDPVNLVDPTGLLPPENPDPRKDWASQMGGTIGAQGRAVGEAAGTVNDFRRNYRDMVRANTIGADKVFHCRANCEGSSRGDFGESLSRGISNAREATDRLRGDPASASASDQKANRAGIAGGRTARGTGERSDALRRPAAEGICEKICNSQKRNKKKGT